MQDSVGEIFRESGGGFAGTRPHIGLFDSFSETDSSINAATVFRVTEYTGDSGPYFSRSNRSIRSKKSGLNLGWPKNRQAFSTRRSRSHLSSGGRVESR